MTPKNAEAHENRAAARLIDQAVKEIVGGVPLVPKPIVDLLANGANPLRTLREWRKMTQRKLSNDTGIGLRDITRLEQSRISRPIPQLEKIASALDVPLELLVQA